MMTVLVTQVKTNRLYDVDLFKLTLAAYDVDLFKPTLAAAPSPRLHGDSIKVTRIA